MGEIGEKRHLEGPGSDARMTRLQARFRAASGDHTFAAWFKRRLRLRELAVWLVLALVLFFAWSRAFG